MAEAAMTDAFVNELLQELDEMSRSTLARDKKAERASHPVPRFYKESGQADLHLEDNNDADDENDDEEKEEVQAQRMTKKLLKQDLIKRHNVLMIRVAYDNLTDDSYFWDCVLIVQSKANNCMVVANNVDRTRDTVQKLAARTSHTCEWLPVTLSGYLRTSLYWARSWCTGMTSYRNSLTFEPTIVFVDAHPIVIPLLKVFFNCPIVSFGFYDTMLDRRKFAILPSKAKTTPEVFRNFCLLHANDLIVPSRATGHKFLQQATHCSFVPTVFYPPVHGRGDALVTFRRKHTVLIIGPWQKYARMEFAFLASQRFFNHELENRYKKDIQFIFIGFMDPNDEDAKEYKQRMQKLFHDADMPFGNRILTFTNPTRNQLWSHYKNCMWIMNVTTCDFAWPVLEGVYFGKPLICLRNVFTDEVITHGVNGFLQNADINEFAKHLHYMYVYCLQEAPASNAYRIARRFSHVGRKTVVDELLLKYFPLTDSEKNE